ncbi:MAG TPA: hypothetical protein VG737_16905 [Cyclobacteriaceae bacterium]|nr:hypothetical protein [Cyclobacteriaceae bacterium]
MRNFILPFLVLISACCFGQQLHKETLFGVHLITVELKPGATIEQFRDFFVKEVLPDYEKHWKGLKGYLVKSARGPSKNKFAVMWVFDTEAVRDRYFNADGTANELEKAALEKVKPIEQKLARYGTYTVEYMDDWVVQ